MLAIYGIVSGILYVFGWVVAFRASEELIGKDSISLPEFYTIVILWPVSFVVVVVYVLCVGSWRLFLRTLVLLGKSEWEVPNE